MMESMEIISEIQKREGVNNSELSRRMGKSPQNMNNILKAGNPHISMYLEMINALGYKVVVTKDEVNGYEIGGESRYMDESEKGEIWKEIESLKARLAEVEGIVK